VLLAAYAIILLRINAQPQERICWFQEKPELEKNAEVL